MARASSTGQRRSRGRSWKRGRIDADFRSKCRRKNAGGALGADVYRPAGKCGAIGNPLVVRGLPPGRGHWTAGAEALSRPKLHSAPYSGDPVRPHRGGGQLAERTGAPFLPGERPSTDRSACMRVPPLPLSVSGDFLGEVNQSPADVRVLDLRVRPHQSDGAGGLQEPQPGINALVRL